MPVNNIDDAKAVFDGLMVERSVGYQLPNWTSPIILSRLEKIYDQTFYVEFMTRRAQMFRTGNWRCHRGYDFFCLLMQLCLSIISVCAGVWWNNIQEKILQKLTLEEKQPRKITKFEWDPVSFAVLKFKN